MLLIMLHKSKKERLDVLLVERQLVPTRSQARALILAGDVVVDDHRLDKPGTLVNRDAFIRLKNPPVPYVSRGGYKLKSALERWPGPIEGAVCIDVGASTGGFTDVLLQHHAAQVFAVDVGYGQIDWRLRQDKRVINHERTHIVKVPVGTFEPAPSVAVVDVSFISLTQVLPALLPHLANKAYLYVLIKPQFEAGREQVEKGGLIRNSKVRQETVDKVLACAQTLGLALQGYAESPITGTDGNVEFVASFVWNK